MKRVEHRTPAEIAKQRIENMSEQERVELTEELDETAGERELTEVEMAEYEILQPEIEIESKPRVIIPSDQTPEQFIERYNSLKEHLTKLSQELK